MTKSKGKHKQATKPEPRDQHSLYIKLMVLSIAILYFLPLLGIISKTSFWAFSVNTYLPGKFVVIQLITVVFCCFVIFVPKLMRITEKIPPPFYYFSFL